MTALIVKEREGHDDVERGETDAESQKTAWKIQIKSGGVL